MAHSAAIRRTIVIAALVAVAPVGVVSEPRSGASGTRTLTLEEAVRLAVAVSPAVQRGAAAVQSAQAQVSAALVPHHATVTATANGAGTYGSDGLSGSTGGTLSVRPAPSVMISAEANASATNRVEAMASAPSPALSVSGTWYAWPPHSLSEDSLTLALAQADRTGTGEALALARIQAALKARHDYQVLQVDIQRTAIAREAALAARATLEHRKASAQQNAIDQADLLESQGDEANARLFLRKATDTEASDRRTLERDIGMEEGQIAPEPWPGLDFTPFALDETSLRSRAERNDPDVQASRRNLTLAQTRLTTAQKRNNLSLRLQAGVQWPTFHTSPLVTVGVQGSYDVADAGKLQAAIDRARSDVAAAQLALESAEDSLSDTLSRQIDAVEEKALEIEAFQYVRDRARVLYLDGQSREKAGAMTADELAATRRGYDTAQLDLDAAVVDYQYPAGSVMQAPGRKPQ
jgi:outer membrane protein TolC